MKILQNNNRIAKIRKTSYAGFEVFVGFAEDFNQNSRTMQVIELKNYKHEKAALKFSQQWLNG